MTKWVYSFGAGHNEGRAEMRNLLGGKGANLAEMASIGLPVPPGFTITTEVCTAYYENNQQVSRRTQGAGDAALAAIEKAVGPEFRRPAQSAAGFGPLRRACLHAGHDGHRAEPGSERRNGRRTGARPPTIPVSPGTATAVSFRCMARVVLGVDHHRFEEIIEHAKLEAGVVEDTALTARTGARWRRLQGPGASGDRQAVPAGAA